MINLLLVFAFLQVPVKPMSAGNITIYRPIDVDASTAMEYLSTLEKMFKTYSTELEFGEEGRLIVRLCDNKYDFSALTGKDSLFAPLWKGGRLYIIARSDINSAGYRTKLETGVIQGILNGMHYNGAPDWLVYSIAVYESGEYEEVSPPPFENVRYFADLEEKIQSASSETDFSDLLFYLGNTGRFFDVKFGAGSVTRLIHEFRRVTDFDAAVRRAFHSSAPVVENEWHRYISDLVDR